MGYWGNPFLPLYEKPNHLSPRPSFTLAHLNWGNFHLLSPFRDTIFSIQCCTSQSSFYPANKSFTRHQAHPLPHQNWGRFCFAPCTKFSEGHVNDDISKVVQSRFPFKPGVQFLSFPIRTAEKYFDRILTTFSGMENSRVGKVENRTQMTQFWTRNTPTLFGV